MACRRNASIMGPATMPISCRTNSRARSYEPGGFTTSMSGTEMIAQIQLLDISDPTRARLLLLERRSEEHTSELQSLMRNSYAVFCLNKKKKTKSHTIAYIDYRYAYEMEALKIEKGSRSGKQQN